MTLKISPGFHGKRHNHKACINLALQNAEDICTERALRFTPIRKRILTLIWSKHEPVLAYGLLKTLRREKQNAEPPTVYRALEFLLENQLVHKIESLNAYVGCNSPGKAHVSQFLICSQCNQVAEIDDPNVNQIISRQGARSGFKVEEQTIEIRGLCPDCQN
jgi:Fur family zinc uptake transcriptional regulator